MKCKLTAIRNTGFDWNQLATPKSIRGHQMLVAFSHECAKLKLLLHSFETQWAEWKFWWSFWLDAEQKSCVRHLCAMSTDQLKGRINLLIIEISQYEHKKSLTHMNLSNICIVIVNSISSEHKIRADRDGDDDESKQCRTNHNSGFLRRSTIAHNFFTSQCCQKLRRDWVIFTICCLFLS